MRFACTGALVGCAALLIASCVQAEQIASDCRITAVDAVQRRVTLLRKTAAGEREGVAKVADNAVIKVNGDPIALDKLSAPVEAAVIYDTERKAVTTITAVKAEPPKSENAPPRAIAPFDAVKAKVLQDAWAKHLGVPVETTNSIGVKLILIPPGEFVMGIPPEESERFVRKAREDHEMQAFLEVIPLAQPPHRVRITRPFYLGTCEITVEQFKTFVGAARFRTDAEKEKGKVVVYDPAGPKWNLAAGLHWQAPGIVQDGNHPVVAISWNDAVACCNWLGEKEGKTYRLPTEAEWEYACRAGTTTAWSVGDDDRQLQTAANIADEAYRRSTSPVTNGVPWNDGFARTSPVGSFRPNPFGLYDMHGNVWERCSDWFGAKYYEQSPAENPTGPANATKDAIYGGTHVARGGAYDTGSHLCRSGHHHGSDPPSGATQYTGFRVVCEIVPTRLIKNGK